MTSLLRSTLSAVLLAATALSAAAKDVVIDVRTPQEYASGHIDGAINIDHTQIGQQIGAAKVGQDDTVILYCRTGRRSALALETLQKMGYRKAVNYGGIDEAARRLQTKSP